MRTFYEGFAAPPRSIASGTVMFPKCDTARAVSLCHPGGPDSPDSNWKYVFRAGGKFFFIESRHQGPCSWANIKEIHADDPEAAWALGVTWANDSDRTAMAIYPLAAAGTLSTRARKILADHLKKHQYALANPEGWVLVSKTYTALRRPWLAKLLGLEPENMYRWFGRGKGVGVGQTRSDGIFEALVLHECAKKGIK